MILTVVVAFVASLISYIFGVRTLFLIFLSGIKSFSESPFEFRALEVALEAICSYLDARTSELEASAYPALDELTSKVCTLSFASLIYLLQPFFLVFLCNN